MANNRMHLVCMLCLEDESIDWRDCHVCVEKYYPSMGWMAADPVDFGERLNHFFEDHHHRTTFGDEFRLTYESVIGVGFPKSTILERINGN